MLERSGGKISIRCCTLPAPRGSLGPIRQGQGKAQRMLPGGRHASPHPFRSRVLQLLQSCDRVLSLILFPSLRCRGPRLFDEARPRRSAHETDSGVFAGLFGAREGPIIIERRESACFHFFGERRWVILHLPVPQMRERLGVLRYRHAPCFPWVRRSLSVGRESVAAG